VGFRVRAQDRADDGSAAKLNLAIALERLAWYLAESREWCGSITM
jgi:hypothetical protein